MGENKKGFRKFEYKRALVARKIYHVVGTPTLRNFKTMIRQNIIHNFPVTVEDINIAEKIFVPDMSTFNGRTTRQR